MAASKKKYEKDILKIITKYNIFSVLDIFAFYTGCSRATFYNNDLDKLDTIKEAIDSNKVKTKQTLKSKWSQSDNPTLQIALYKSICTDTERQSLSQTYVDHTSKGESVVKTDFSNYSDEDLATVTKVAEKYILKKK